MIKRLEAFTEIDVLRHRRAQRRAGAVGADHECRLVFARDAGLIEKLQGGPVPIDGSEALVELNARAGCFGGIEQRDV